MKEYEGPVFQNRQQKRIEASKFNRSSQRHATRRSFKPVSESRQHTYETAYQDRDKERFERLKHVRVERDVLSDEPTPSEVYDIPFMRQQDKRASVRQRMSKASTQPAEEVNMNERTPRSVYEPSFKQDARRTEIIPEPSEPEVPQSLVEEEVDTPFRPKQMPKPYRGAKEMAEIDLHTRELAKRLVKTKDSFLLFEEE
ncbi:hypothetical protein NHG28_02230 [Aerococcaceae bacterium NML201209]|nr:hypothetical protein [Aerococcaceae bacterium NML201209]